VATVLPYSSNLHQLESTGHHKDKEHTRYRSNGIYGKQANRLRPNSTTHIPKGSIADVLVPDTPGHPQMFFVHTLTGVLLA